MKTITIELPDEAEKIYLHIAFNRNGQRPALDYLLPETERIVMISYGRGKWEAMTNAEDT